MYIHQGGYIRPRRQKGNDAMRNTNSSSDQLSSITGVNTSPFGNGPHHPYKSQRHCSKRGQLVGKQLASYREIPPQVKNVLNSFQPKDKMPDLLQEKPNPKVVGDVGVGDPLQDPDIVFPRSLPDLVAGDDELAAAETADAERRFFSRGVEQLRVNLRKQFHQVEVVEVVHCRIKRVPRVGTERRRRAAQIDESAGFDGLESKTS